MELDYDELRRVYRLEKNTSKLVEVPEDFYNSLNEFVQKEKQLYLESLKDLSSSKGKEFANLKRVVEELFALRQKKLLNQALISTRTQEMPEQSMALQEKELFKQLLESLQKHSAMLSEIFSNNNAKKQEGRKQLEELKVKVLKEVPAFVGADLKEYGPFKAEQAVTLPFKIAKLLVSRELAELEEIE